MGKRFVPGATIERRMQAKDDRMNREMAARRAAADQAHVVADLLAALKALVDRHGWVPGLGECVCVEHQAAHAAIAKAEGHSHD